MWRWARTSTSPSVFWGSWSQSTKGSVQQNPELRGREDATFAPYPATASPGAKPNWWDLWRLTVPKNTSSISLLNSPQFDLTKLEPEPPAPTMGSGVLEAGGDFSPPDSPPSTDYFPDYMVTVIVPLILAIVLCLLLAYIMFGRREGVYVSDISLQNNADFIFFFFTFCLWSVILSLEETKTSLTVKKVVIS